jgi:hypothetical protein
MSEPYEFDPNSLNELVHLLPDPCKSCPFAEFIIAMARKEPEDIGAPLDVINHIGILCTGYEGPDTASIYYSEFFDRSGCPFVTMLRPPAI